MALAGGKLAGGNPKNGRVENDYYATNPKAVEMLLTNYTFDADTILEPCVGGGHIANAINNFYTNKRDVTGIDIVDRGYPNTVVADFLTWKTDKKFEGIISNPPYSLAKEFIEKSINLLDNNGQIAMFLKIQFLEGGEEKNFLKNIHRNIFMYLETEWQHGIMVKN